MTWLVFLCALEREALSQLQEWDTNYEVAWNWLWDNVATLLATMAALVGLSVFLQLSYGLVRASISASLRALRYRRSAAPTNGRQAGAFGK